MVCADREWTAVDGKGRTEFNDTDEQWQLSKGMKLYPIAPTQYLLTLNFAGLVCKGNSFKFCDVCFHQYSVCNKKNIHSGHEQQFLKAQQGHAVLQENWN